VAVCDAESDADLDTVHAAAVLAGGEGGILLVGSGALVDAAVRSLPLDARRGARAAEPGAEPGGRSALFVLGTRATGLPDQLAALAAAHTTHEVRLSPDRLLADPAGVTDELRAARESRSAARRGLVVTLDPDEPVDPTRSRALTESLARAVAPVVDAYAAAFLSGGETARAVLDRLGVDALEVVGELGTGTVVSRRPGGALVVTRPGSFGDPTSLVRVADHLLGPAPDAVMPPAAATPEPQSAPDTRRTTETAPPRPTTRTATGAPTEENP
jgi:4-hydroxythreonine-4-phosphate dehydrogenase